MNSYAPLTPDHARFFLYASARLAGFGPGTAADVADETVSKIVDYEAAGNVSTLEESTRFFEETLEAHDLDKIDE